MLKSLLKPLPNGHSNFAPSAGERWLTCPGSVQLIYELVKDAVAGPMNIYAAEGTFMHSLAAMRLTNKKLPKVGSVHVIDEHKITYTKEHKEAIDQYVDVVQWFLDKYGGKLHVETQISLDAFGYSTIKGTPDAAIDALPVLIIGDLKGGAGIYVEVKDNVQLKLYSAMRMSHDAFMYKKVINFIVQPRHRNTDFYSVAEYSAQEIEDFVRNDVKKAIQSALSESPQFQPSEKACKWCEAKQAMVCKAFTDFGFKIAQKDFTVYEEFKPMKVNTLSPSEISSMLKALPLMNDFISSLNLYAIDQLKKGIEIPGFELKEGRSQRKWSEEDEKKMAKILKTVFHLKHGEIFSKKLNGPAPIEALVKNPDDREKLNSYIIKPPGKPTIASVDDQRSRVEPMNTPQQDFKHDIFS